MMEAILGPVRLAFRGTGLVLVVAWGVLLTGSLLLLRPFGRRTRDAALQSVARHWFRQLQRVLGVRPLARGVPANGPVLLAANHISWLDIVVLGSQVGTCFVSKSEVASWPVVGWLARQGGTLFVHRGRHESAERIAHDMTRRLAQGNRVLFFPEGTTSDGTDVRRFKNRLFQPALAALAPVQPVAIRYLPGREVVNPVAYIEGVSFLGSIVRVMKRSHTDVRVTWCDPLEVRGRERREVAGAAEDEVRRALANETGSDAGPGIPVSTL